MPPIPPINIAAVSYLNTAPLIQGLDAWNDANIIRAVPSQIANLILTNQADIGLASIIDFAHAKNSKDPLVMIPAGMIGCHGPTLTVKLLSSVPIKNITTVHADTDSHTSVVLSKIILSKLHNINPTFINHTIADHPNQSTQPQTLLVIGDKVVTASLPKTQYPHQIDLGQAWNDLTNLPFVYATWMCKQSSIDNPQSKANIIAAAHILERTMLKNQTRIDWIIANCAKSAGWPTELAKKYLGELLRFNVDDHAKQAVNTFLTMAAELTATPKAHPTWLNLNQPLKPSKAIPQPPSPATALVKY